MKKYVMLFSEFNEQIINTNSDTADLDNTKTKNDKEGKYLQNYTEEVDDEDDKGSVDKDEKPEPICRNFSKTIINLST